MEIVDEASEGKLTVLFKNHGGFLEFARVTRTVQDNGFLVVTHFTEAGKRVSNGYPLDAVKSWTLTWA